MATAPVTRTAVAARQVVEGVVEAVSAATVGAQVAGRIVAVDVESGDAVVRGQVLMRIDARAAEQAVAVATAQVARARAALTDARDQWQRSEALRAQDFISPARVDQARAAMQAAEEAYRAAQA
ncbi:MAG: biotin/lipoyl-binding protein, partial [Rhodocyclaceae bacterium]|nr:biotin/lipoyl-binding protein [Rhodocyclaceae bacterium]